MGESSNTLLCPWLLYSHGDKNYRNKTFCNVAGSPSQSSSIPHLKNKTVTILGSSHGWLILKYNNTEYNNSDSKYAPPAPDFYYLCNPISLESIHFPPFNSKPDHMIFSFILSSSPSDGDPNSMLLLFEAAIPAVFVCWISNPQWVELKYGSFYNQVWGDSAHGKFKFEIGYLRSPISYNGNVFAIGGKRNLFRVEVKLDNTILLHPLIHLPLFPASRSNIVRENLVECCGELYLVHCTTSDVQDSSTRIIAAVHVLKLNFSGMIWERVENIHDHAFFLSYHIAISCSSVAALSSFPALKNRIYFTMYEDKNIILYFYQVEDGTLTMYRPCLDLPTPWSPPIWVSLPTLGTNKDEQKEENLKALVFAEERKDNKDSFFPWTDLPTDVQKLISETLPPFDYMNFSAVCRMNHKIAPPIQWRSKLAGSDQSDQLHFPWLIYSPAGKNVCNLLVPILNRRYIVKTPEAFQDPIVCCCKEGWLLMSQSRNLEDDLFSMFLFNPFTKSTIQLPSIKFKGGFPTARFSLLPYSSDRCYIVYFLHTYETVEFYIIYPWRTWQRSIIRFFNEVFHPVDSAPVFLNNRLYYLGEDGKLGILKRTEERWRWEVLDVQDRPGDFQHNYLVECDGKLLSVFVGYSGRWVKVFRLHTYDSTPCRWEPVLDLGKHVLYLSRLSTVSKVAQVEGTENRIYFERLYRERIIYYSLDTKKFHTSYDKDSRKTYYNTSEPLLCAWIEPNWCDKLPQCK